MYLTKTSIRSATLRVAFGLVACVLGLSAQGADIYKTFYQWRGNENQWLKWGDAANWYVTNTVDKTRQEASTPPGKDDVLAVCWLQVGENNFWISSPQNIWADLDGKDWSINTFDMDLGWRSPSARLNLTNGTLTITGIYEFYGKAQDNTLYDGATLTVANTVANCYEGRDNASRPPWIIKKGATFNMLAQKLNLFNTHVTVEEGGTYRLEPKKVIWSNASWPNRYINRGMLIITNGFDFTGSSEPNNAKSTIYNYAPDSANGKLRRDGWSSYVSFDHFGGTFKMGGLFSNGGLTDGAYYVTWQNTCSVEVVRDLSFEGFDCAVSNNAVVALAVNEGVKADLSTFNFGANTTITKTGMGTVLVGDNYPTMLTVAQGGLEFVTTTPDLSGVTLTDGAQIVFGCKEKIGLSMPANYKNLDFNVDLDRALIGSAFFATAEAEVRTHVKNCVQAHLPATVDIAEDGENLVLLAHKENTIAVTGEMELTAEDYAQYANQDIILRGHGVVTLTPQTPAFNSIVLELGATLQVQGGTEEAPLVLPMLNAALDTKVLIAGGAYVNMTNGWSFSANAQNLPVFEIATNAILFVQDVAYPNRGIYFKNVDFRLYGQLRVPKSSDSGSYMGSQMFFGYADAGETTYLAFTADGGSIYAPHQAAAYLGNRSLVSLACPAVTGRVKVMRDILFRDYRKIQDLNSPDNPIGNTANSGYFFGVNNPVEEEFNVIVDNCLISPAGPTKIAGGAHLTFINGGHFERPQIPSQNHSYGHTRGMWIQDAGTMTFDGGKFFLDHPCGTSELGNGLTVNPSAANAPALVLGGGVQFTLWNQYGNGNGVCTVTDATFYVPRLHPPRLDAIEKNNYAWNVMSTWTQTNTPAFNGFASVNVPLGGVLRFDASDELTITQCGESSTNRYGELSFLAQDSSRAWYCDYWEWNRTTALEVPVTGAGDIVVTNSLAGVDERDGKWYWEKEWGTLPDLSTWSMNLVLRGAANTCTGSLSAETNVNAFVYLADGATWAGTVRANSHIKFGDPIAEGAGAAVKPVSVRVGALALEGPLNVRLWNDGSTKTNDFLAIAGASTGTGRKVGLAGVGMAGYEPQPGEYFTVARCPKAALAPKAARGWKVVVVDDPDDADSVLVKLTACPAGTQVFIR